MASPAVAPSMLVFRAPGGGTGIVGLARGSGQDELLITVQGDGVIAVDVEKQERTGTWVLGSKGTEFAAPAVLDAASRTLMTGVSALAAPSTPARSSGGPHAARPPSALLCAQAGASSSRLLDASQARLPLDGALLSLHALEGAASAAAAQDAEGRSVTSAGAVTVAVCTDGSVAAVATPCSGGQPEVLASSAGSRCHGTRALAATTSGRTLYVVSIDGSGPQRAAFLNVFTAKGDVLQRTCVAALERPDAGSAAAAADVVAATVAGARLALVWGDGWLQSYRTAHLAGLAGSGSADPAPLAPTASLQLRGFALGGAAGCAPPSSAKVATGGKKKRGSDALSSETQGGAGAGPGLAAVPLAEGVVGVVGWAGEGGGAAGAAGAGEPGSSGASGLAVAVVDARYGVLQSTQALGGLDGGDGGGGGGLPRRGGAVAALALEGGRLAVAGGGAVLVAALPVQPSSLAALVGIAAPAAALAAPRGAAGGEAGPAAAASWGVLLAAPQLSDAQGAQGGGWALEPALPQDARWDVSVAEARQSAEADAYACIFAARATPGASSSAALESLAGSLPADGGAGSPSAPLAGALALALAEARRWEALAALLARAPPPTLAVAPGLLYALLAGRQYSTAAALLLTAADVGAPELGAALQLLLAPGAGAGEAGAAAAAFHTRLLPGAGAGAGAASKQGGGGGGEAGSGAEGGDAVLGPLLARFAPPESVLHLLLAPRHDAGVLVGALRALRPGEALSLASYLLKWLQWYGGNMLSAPPACAVGPLPCLEAVVEWSGALVDAQLTALALQCGSADGRHVFEALRSAVARIAGSLRRAAGLQGVLEHLTAGAALPLPQSTLHFSVELLDLSAA